MYTYIHVSQVPSRLWEAQSTPSYTYTHTHTHTHTYMIGAKPPMGGSVYSILYIHPPTHTHTHIHTYMIGAKPPMGGSVYSVLAWREHSGRAATGARSADATAAKQTEWSGALICYVCMYVCMYVYASRLNGMVCLFHIMYVCMSVCEIGM
jgi:hypothetical protein